MITSFSPNKGPQSGGTYLTIHGHHLNAGSLASAVLSNGSLETRCSFVRRQLSSAVCVTESAPVLYSADTVLINIDNAVLPITGPRFRFVRDPVIESVNPEKGIFR